MQTFESCKSVLSCSRANRKKVRVYTSSMLAGPLLDIITTPYPGCWSSCNPYYKTKWQCMLFDYQTPDQGTLSIQLNSPIAEWLKSYHLKLSHLSKLQHMTHHTWKNTATSFKGSGHFVCRTTDSVLCWGQQCMEQRWAVSWKPIVSFIFHQVWYCILSDTLK